MTKQTTMLFDYIGGKLSAEQANEELAKHGLNIRIDPNRCNLTDEQIADGWGLLDTGTGTMDPARMTDGKLVNVDCGDSYALFFHDGKMYEVKGKDLFLK